MPPPTTHAAPPAATPVRLPLVVARPAVGGVDATDLSSLGPVRRLGVVSYDAHPADTGASPFRPFGTVVTITNPANGATVRRVVDDREADTVRAVDPATSTSAELAPLSQGLVTDAELRW